jgi:Uncharacterised protein family (UPF0158)
MAKMKQEAQNPLILRCHRLMEAFAKSDDERDFYIDRLEGFLIYVDLDKPSTEIETLEVELRQNKDRYCLIPKMSFYETKKIMEGFVNEKVYDIDTKEKLLDIIQSKEARENFLEFIYDHHSEQEKWQQFYQERSRIRIIEWLRQNHFHFVFEEDLDLPRQILEKLKQSLFQPKVGKDILNARKTLVAKAKTYYSNEALNPRPKRGRPPKQAIKPDVEPQVTLDIFIVVPLVARPFLFTPEPNTSSAFSIFSSKFDSDDQLPLGRRPSVVDTEASLTQKLASLRSLSTRWVDNTPPQPIEDTPYSHLMTSNFDDEEEDDLDEDEKPKAKIKPKAAPKTKEKLTRLTKVPVKGKASASKPPVKSKPEKPEKPKVKRIISKPVKETTPAKKKPKELKKIIPVKKPTR